MLSRVKVCPKAQVIRRGSPLDKNRTPKGPCVLLFFFFVILLLFFLICTDCFCSFYYRFSFLIFDYLFIIISLLVSCA